MLRYSCVLFDADNTLFDFDKAQSRSLEKSLWHLIGRFEPSWLSVYNEISKRYWRRFESGTITIEELQVGRFADFISATGIRIHQRDLKKNYIENLSQCSMLVPNCESVVRQLAEYGCKLVIITNGISIIQRPRIQQSSLVPFLSDIVISDEVGWAKPAPEIFQIALEKLGNPPKNQILMVGDNLISDIAGAANFGFDTCWYPAGPQSGIPQVHSTYAIKDLTELLNVVTKV